MLKLTELFLIYENKNKNYYATHSKSSAFVSSMDPLFKLVVPNFHFAVFFWLLEFHVIYFILWKLYV